VSAFRSPSRWSLTIGSGGVHLLGLRNRLVLSQAEATCGALEDLPATLTTLREEAECPAKPVSARVVLGRPFVQYREIHGLPLVSQPVLARLIAGEASRFFRQNGSPLVTTAGWMPSPRGAPPVAAAAAADHDLLETMHHVISAAGFRVSRFDLEFAGQGPSGPRLWLVPPSARSQRKMRERRQLRMLGIATATLWITMAIVAGAAHWRHRREVEARIAQLSQPAGALLRVRQEMAKADSMIAAIRVAREDRRRIAIELGRIARTLPEAAFLSTLTLDLTQGARLTGSSSDPGSVLDAFEAAPGSRHVGMESGSPASGNAVGHFAITYVLP